ncbi:MAG: tRNA (adenosine(37)-N6)-threonylcarbamoyltransferase complex dimerization subunit type 1 TsaB [Spirochaetia bacterium]|nr:tRNA (adenosine(37)-N6)-threonylcarbamoyltransferase complex dimerization subunit type 1 TsaB [Spirochaetia bacterium]
MNILALDTSGTMLDIALEARGKLYSRYRQIGLQHSEHIMPAVIELCTEASITIKQLELLVVTRGPGSFTGLRIGMAAAKGLAFGLQIPLVSVPTLDALAAAAGLAYGNHNEEQRVTVPVIDARKQRYYAALYKSGNRVSEYLDISPEDLLNNYLIHCNDILLAGPDSERFLMLLQETGLPTDSPVISAAGSIPAAPFLIEAGLRQFETNGSDSADQGPLYIRNST